jgi:hypothetical protein
MFIDAEHLRIVTERNIHIVRWPHDADRVEPSMREAAIALNYHFALLDGRALRTEQEVLWALYRALEFPIPTGDGTPNWDSAADWTGDLSWLLMRPDTNATECVPTPHKQGILVFLREPEHLIQSNALDFSFLLDTIGTRSQYVLKYWNPFHVVVGPMPEDYRYESFMNLLSVSQHFCEACQMVDGDSLLEESDLERCYLPQKDSNPDKD